MIALALSLALASPIQDFPSGSGELVVERVDGSEPLRLNVRSSSAPARVLLGEVARVASLKLTDVPEELAGSVGPVALRDVPPTRAVEAIVGVLGYLVKVDGGKLVIERAPDPGAHAARDWYRDHAQAQFEDFLAFESDHPRAPRAWLELAFLHEEAGDLEGAIEALHSLRESQPNAVEAVDALVQMGRMEMLLGRIDGAVGYLTTAVDKHAAHAACAEAYALLGRCRLATDSLDMANRYFKIGLERFPKSPASLSSKIWRVDALRRLGQVEKAWIEIEELESLPLTVGQAYELLEVRTRVADATGFHGEATEGWLALASVERNANNRRDFLESARASAAKSGDSLCELFASAAPEGASHKAKVGNWLLEQDFVEAALRYTSDDAGVKLRVALTLAERGALVDARELLAASPIAPQWMGTRKLIEAELAIRGGEPAQVPKILGAAIESSTDKSFVNAALRKLGEAYVALHDFERADSAFRGIVPKEERP